LTRTKASNKDGKKKKKKKSKPAVIEYKAVRDAFKTLQSNQRRALRSVLRKEKKVHAQVYHHP
jgi:parvulin-like peptidyl-prolyl isomerase